MTPSESRALFGWAIDLDYMAKTIRDRNVDLSDTFRASAATLRALADQKIDSSANGLWCERCGGMWTTHNTEAHDLLAGNRAPDMPAWVFKDRRLPHPAAGIYVTIAMTKQDAIEAAAAQDCEILGYVQPL